MHLLFLKLKISYVDLYQKSVSTHKGNIVYIYSRQNEHGFYFLIKSIFKCMINFLNFKGAFMYRSDSITVLVLFIYTQITRHIISFSV